MSYLIGGVVPLLSNGLIEVPYAGMWLERWGLPNEDGRLGVYVGETRGVHEVAGNPTDPPTPEFMFLAELYGSVACAQTTLFNLLPSPAVDGNSCIVGEGLYVGKYVVIANGGGLMGSGEFSSLIMAIDAHHTLIWF